MIKKRIISCIISAAMLICMTATMPFSASAEIVEIFKDDFENGFGGWQRRRLHKRCGRCRKHRQ